MTPSPNSPKNTLQSNSAEIDCQAQDLLDFFFITNKVNEVNQTFFIDYNLI